MLNQKNLKRALQTVTRAYGHDKAQQAYLNLLERQVEPTLKLWLREANRVKTPKYRYVEVPLGSRQPIQPSEGSTFETELGN